VLESSKIGKVPNAATADTAGSAGTAGNANGVGGFRVVRVPAFTLGNSESRQIAQNGPLTFTAACRINVDPDGAGGNDPFDDARVLIDTSVDNAAYDADDGDADFDAADPPVSFAATGDGLIL